MIVLGFASLSPSLPYLLKDGNAAKVAFSPHAYSAFRELQAISTDLLGNRKKRWDVLSCHTEGRYCVGGPSGDEPKSYSERALDLLSGVMGMVVKPCQASESHPFSYHISP